MRKVLIGSTCVNVRAPSESFRRVSGSFRRGFGSFRGMSESLLRSSGSFREECGSFRRMSESIRTMGGSFRRSPEAFGGQPKVSGECPKVSGERAKLFRESAEVSAGGAKVFGFGWGLSRPSHSPNAWSSAFMRCLPVRVACGRNRLKPELQTPSAMSPLCGLVAIETEMGGKNYSQFFEPSNIPSRSNETRHRLDFLPAHVVFAESLRPIRA